jgi:hypothetical protein
MNICAVMKHKYLYHRNESILPFSLGSYSHQPQLQKYITLCGIKLECRPCRCRVCPGISTHHSVQVIMPGFYMDGPQACPVRKHEAAAVMDSRDLLRQLIF